jgi:hypothetical protein
VIGRVYLLPTEVSLSPWVFFRLFRLVRVARVMVGFEAVEPTAPKMNANRKEEDLDPDANHLTSSID